MKIQKKYSLYARYCTTNKKYFFTLVIYENFKFLQIPITNKKGVLI